MNILDRQFRHVVCNGQFFVNYETMEKDHPEYVNEDWEYKSFGDWMLDPHTGEAKMLEEWQCDWIEDANPAWEGLTWNEVENSLQSVVCDFFDPEGKTFISSDMAREMMHGKDPLLMDILEKEKCRNASLQDVWEAFWSCQMVKEMKSAVQNA